MTPAPANYCAIHDSVECELPHARRCECHARMAGECMCGAWDEPIGALAMSVEMSSGDCTCYAEDFDSNGVECLWCRWTALRTLAANLATAGALCRAWDVGSRFHLSIDPSRWWPGCGDAAP